MRSGKRYMLGEEALRQIREVIREYAHRYWNERPASGRWTQTQQPCYCKLDGDLAAATLSTFDTSSRPSATASVWVSDGSGGIQDSGRNITVVNRFGVEYTAATMGIASWMCGEWVYVGDCGPLS